MPQDISRTVLGLSAGRSDTCKRFLTTIYTEKTSPNIDIDFLGAGRRWGDSSRRNRPKQRLLARGTRVMLHGGPARRPRHPASLVVAVFHREGMNPFPRCFPWPMSCLTLWVIREKMRVVVDFHDCFHRGSFGVLWAHVDNRAGRLDR